MDISNKSGLSLVKRLLHVYDAEKVAKALALDAKARFSVWTKDHCGVVSALKSAEFVHPKIEVDRAQLEILDGEVDDSRLLLGIREGEYTLTSKVTKLDSDMNSALKLWLPRFSTRGRKESYNQIRALIGDDNRIKPRGFLAFDNIVSGFLYSSLASYLAGFAYHHLYAGQSLSQSLSWATSEQNGAYVLGAAALSAICALGAQLRRYSSDEVKDKARVFQNLVERIGFVNGRK